MPKVKLISSNGYEESNSGVCFGFTGRSPTNFHFDRDKLLRNEGKVVTYIYYIGDHFDSNFKSKGLNAITPYLKFICESSSWSKYVLGLSLNSDITKTTVDIRTDIPGHCIIGTASAVRLANKKRDSFIPFFNLACNAGANPAIALLVFYALGESVLKDIKVGSEGELLPFKPQRLPNPPSTSSGRLNLSDDEVIDTSNVSAGLLYSFIAGDYEMIRKDRGNEEFYETALIYKQDILNSFTSKRGNRKNLGEFLLERFRTSLQEPDVINYSGGFGSSSRLQSTRVSPIGLSTLVGWVLQLTMEYNSSGRFYGWRT